MIHPADTSLLVIILAVIWVASLVGLVAHAAASAPSRSAGAYPPTSRPTWKARRP